MHRLARARLRFDRSGPAALYAESPIRLLTPRSRGGTSLVFVSGLGGGMLGGDSFHLEAEVGGGAGACLCTQGPTRVFPSAEGCESALDARVGENGRLILAPDPIACFAGARFEQRTRISLHETASFAGWELLSAGRDHWGFARCRTSLRLERAGRPVFDETLLLDPAHGPIARRFGRFRALATLIFCGREFVAAAKIAKASIEAARARGAPVVESATALAEDVLVVRLAAISAERAMAALRGHLPELEEILGRRDASFAA